jgi:ornithine carbamoyltransferase
MALRHITKVSDLSRPEIASVLSLAMDMKKTPSDYWDALKRKTLLMLFEKPSLRTRVSLETGMTQLGGHGIAYMTGDSPVGLKESYEDTAACLSRMCDGITARVNSRDQIHGLANNASIPVVNALDDYAHPMQMLADLQVMMEHSGVGPNGTLDGLQGAKFAFVGDLQNNVTYDLMRAGCIMGLEVKVAGPKGTKYDIEGSVLEECAVLSALSGAGSATVVDTAEEACAGADFVYADSWMSYGISQEARDARFAMMEPYQVNAQLMALANPSAKFMNCLPAMRGEEQTAEVIDGPQSIVFDQAENRLHAQKALLAKLLLRQL